MLFNEVCHSVILSLFLDVKSTVITLLLVFTFLNLESYSQFEILSINPTVSSWQNTINNFNTDTYIII